jgi:hypothetical protein
MRIEIFALCDAATSESGKLNILGAFDTAWVYAMPAVYPQCAIALRIRFSAIEKGEHLISVNFVDIDGKHIIPSASGMVKVDFPAEKKSDAANLILVMQGFKLEQYGEYSIDLAVDGRSECSLPFFVKKPVIPGEPYGAA